MTAKNKLLSVLSDVEQEALYGLPDFDDGQQLEYLSLSETELALSTSRPSLHAQVSCVLQIGSFKAKHAFFRFDWSMVEGDCAFVLSRYFRGEAFERKEVTDHEYYTQRGLIAELFGYQLWSAEYLPQLVQQAAQIMRRDVTPGFVATELIVWLKEHTIVRPGYTTLQELIGTALAAERHRLGTLLEHALDDSAKAALAQLIARDDTLSELAVLRQDGGICRTPQKGALGSFATCKGQTEGQSRGFCRRERRRKRYTLWNTRHPGLKLENVSPAANTRS